MRIESMNGLDWMIACKQQCENRDTAYNGRRAQMEMEMKMHRRKHVHIVKLINK